jgi:hypothetical protein
MKATVRVPSVSTMPGLREYCRDPLFVFDGSDDLKAGCDYSRMLEEGTILIEMPLPPTVHMGDYPKAKSVILTRGIPAVFNTSALDPVLTLDGRDPDLPTQALDALQRHAQVTRRIPRLDLFRIVEFEKTRSGDMHSGPTPVLPHGRTISEIRGNRFLLDADAPITGDFKTGACALCQQRLMLNQTN